MPTMMKATIVATLRVDSMYSTYDGDKSIAKILGQKGIHTQFTVGVNTRRVDKQEEDEEDE